MSQHCRNGGREKNVCRGPTTHHAGAHTDWGFCTFVDTDDTPGASPVKNFGYSTVRAYACGKNLCFETEFCVQAYRCTTRRSGWPYPASSTPLSLTSVSDCCAMARCVTHRTDRSLCRRGPAATLDERNVQVDAPPRSERDARPGAVLVRVLCVSTIRRKGWSATEHGQTAGCSGPDGSRLMRRLSACRHAQAVEPSTSPSRAPSI